MVKKLMNTAIKTGTNFNSKYGKKLTDTAIKTGKDFATIAGKKIVHKTAEATGDLIGNKIADKITAKPSPKDVTSASKKSQNEEIQSNEVNNEIPKERYISPKERQKIIDYSQITFKTTMLKSSFCDYSDAYILVKGTISVNNTVAEGAAVNNTNKKVIFKNCAQFTNCISEINNTKIDNTKDIDIVMSMYNLIEYSDDYAKTTGSLWQYCKDIPARNNNNEITEFTGGNTTDSFTFKAKITGQTGNGGTKDVEIMVPLKYSNNFWRTLEMPLINCEVNLILTWSSTCVIISTNIANQNATFAITDAKLYVPVVTLSTQENTKFLQQLESGFKIVINWNKYLSNPELLAQNSNLNHLVEPSFQGVNRLFVLAFENDDHRTSDDRYYLPAVEIKDYNIMINVENFFDQPIKNNKVTYENIRKIATGQGDDYTTGCLLDYPYFLDTYKTVAVDFSKQQALDADPRAIQQINFTANLDRAGNTRVYFILEEAKETILDFSQGTVKVL